MQKITMAFSLFRLSILAVMIAISVLIMTLLPDTLISNDVTLLSFFILPVVCWFTFFYAKDQRAKQKRD